MVIIFRRQENKIMYEVVGYGQTIEEATDNAVRDLKAPVDAEVYTELIEEPRKKIFGIFGGSPAKVKAYYNKTEYIKKQDKIKKEQEAKKKEQKAKKWIDKLNKAVSDLSSGDYQNAESEFLHIKKFYTDKQTEIKHLSDDRSRAYQAQDEKRQLELTEKIKGINEEIAVVKEFFGDIEIGYAVATFKKCNSIIPERVAELLGVINRNDCKNGIIEREAAKVKEEYLDEYNEKARKNYEKALDYMDKGEYHKARECFVIPQLMRYKDSTTLNMILCFMVDNNPMQYDEIAQEIINNKDNMAATKYKSLAEDIFRLIVAWKKNERSYAGLTGVDSAAFDAAYKVYKEREAASPKIVLTDEEIDFMNWVNRNK